MTSHSMPSILEDLAAGRIDAAEAARRIDALKNTDFQDSDPQDSDQGPSDQNESSPAASDSADTASRARPEAGDAPDAGDAGAANGSGADAWAAATDRPQYATHTTESVGSSPASADDSTPSGPRARSGEPPRHARRGGDTSGVERISVRAVGRRIRIVGEPSVATVAADGPHVLRRNGSVLEISSDGEIGASMDGFTLLKTRSLDDIRSLGLGKELFLRVNPDVVVDVEVTAGSLNTEEVPHLGKIRVTAGGAKLLGVEQVEDVLVQAGQATVRGCLQTGRSRIRAESGSLNVQLDDDSDVTVHAEAQLGKYSWSGGHSGSGDEVVMGNGHAHLDVEVVMGHAQVKVGSTAEEAGR